ncbi:transcriptional regulator, TetR family [Lachnospiraceae bacterium NE2001]|nr:transcriptional regulator, TetR family [Lachnospiraceae bacterium NE2001]
MENEKETKKKLLECAMKEFSEKGYMKASIRNICKEAGVTTGALYFFFKDKEDLFGNLVGGPLMKLEKLIDDHFSEEIVATQKVTKESSGKGVTVADLAAAQGFEDDTEIAKVVVKYLFQEKEAFDLLLTKSQGSIYETVVDKIVDKVEDHYTMMYVAMKGYKSKRELTKEDKFIIHWMSHDQIDIFLHLVTHCKNVKEAESQMSNMMAYMIGGWFGVINNK